MEFVKEQNDKKCDTAKNNYKFINKIIESSRKKIIADSHHVITYFMIKF